MDKQLQKFAAKWFVVAREGATVDDRTINRSWIEQCAKNYDPKKYGARINLEHFKYRLLWKDEPHSLCYGDVLAVKTEEDDEGKLQLLAQIDPTPELVELNKKRQKVYTSVEIDPNFADTGEAYLVGLAVTDNPASLGTSMLKFTARTAEGEQNTEVVFGAAIEQVMEFSEQKSSILAQVKALFARKEDEQKEQQTESEKRFTENEQAILLLTQNVQELSEALTKAQTENANFAAKVAEYDAQFEKLAAEESKHYTPTPKALGEHNAKNGRIF